MTVDEYNTLISLIFTNIIRLYNVFVEESAQYLVLEYWHIGSINEKGKLIYYQFINYSKQVFETIWYYCRHFIDGKLIPRNIQKAKKYFSNCINSKDPSILTLYGKIQREEGKLEEAEMLFKKAAKAGSTESMLEYGKKHYYESIKYLMMAQKMVAKKVVNSLTAISKNQ